MPDEDKILFWIWEFDDVRYTHSIALELRVKKN